MCISKGDDTSPVANDRVSRREMSYLPREMRHLSTGDVGDLQNFGYVTLLIEEREKHIQNVTPIGK
jgi:hypothetical protein